MAKPSPKAQNSQIEAAKTRHVTLVQLNVATPAFIQAPGKSCRWMDSTLLQIRQWGNWPWTERTKPFAQKGNKYRVSFR